METVRGVYYNKDIKFPSMIISVRGRETGGRNEAKNKIADYLYCNNPSARTADRTDLRHCAFHDGEHVSKSVWHEGREHVADF